MVDVGELSREDGDSPFLFSLLQQSDTWTTDAWRDSSLLMARAGLKHMLAKVERELGQRRLMGPLR